MSTYGRKKNRSHHLLASFPVLRDEDNVQEVGPKTESRIQPDDPSPETYPELEQTLDTTEMLLDELLDDWMEQRDYECPEKNTGGDDIDRLLPDTNKNIDMDKPLPAPPPNIFQGLEDPDTLYTEDKLSDADSREAIDEGKLCQTQRCKKQHLRSNEGAGNAKERFGKLHQKDKEIPATVSKLSASQDTKYIRDASALEEKSSGVKKGRKTLKKVKSAFRSGSRATESEMAVEERQLQNKDYRGKERQPQSTDTRVGEESVKAKEQSKQRKKLSRENKASNKRTTAESLTTSEISIKNTISRKGFEDERSTPVLQQPLVETPQRSPPKTLRRPSDFSAWTSPLSQHTDVELFSSSPMDHSTPNARLLRRTSREDLGHNNQQVSTIDPRKIENSLHHENGGQQLYDGVADMEIHKDLSTSKRRPKERDASASLARSKKAKKSTAYPSSGGSVVRDIHEPKFRALLCKDPNQKLRGDQITTSKRTDIDERGRTMEPQQSYVNEKDGSKITKQKGMPASEAATQRTKHERRGSGSTMSLTKCAESSDMDELQMDSSEYQIRKKR